MDNKNGWLTNNRHINQLKKHILAVSTCKIHRLKRNSTSVTALNMVRCPYQVGDFSWRKARPCVCVVHVCRYTHLASYTFGQILGQCLHVIPEESGLSSKPVSGNKGANLGLERDQSQGTSTAATWLQSGSCSLPELFLSPSPRGWNVSH